MIILGWPWIWFIYTLAKNIGYILQNMQLVSRTNSPLRVPWVLPSMWAKSNKSITYQIDSPAANRTLEAFHGVLRYSRGSDFSRMSQAGLCTIVIDILRRQLDMLLLKLSNLLIKCGWILHCWSGRCRNGMDKVNNAVMMESLDILVLNVRAAID